MRNDNSAPLALVLRQLFKEKNHKINNLGLDIVGRVKGIEKQCIRLLCKDLQEEMNI